MLSVEVLLTTERRLLTACCIKRQVPTKQIAQPNLLSPAGQKPERGYTLHDSLMIDGVAVNILCNSLLFGSFGGLLLANRAI